jgi:ribonuclease VapC
MIIDSSVLIAILRDESDASKYAEAIESAVDRRISAATFVEVAVIVDCSHNPVLSRRFDNFMREAGISIEAVTERQAHIARAAYRDFGKGSKHPARLNFGDCFAYALAKDRGESLLFKGADFSFTDVPSALEL